MASCCASGIWHDCEFFGFHRAASWRHLPNREPSKRLGEARGEAESRIARACIAELRVELAEAEKQLREMEEVARLEALVKVRSVMRAFELTPADLRLTSMPKRRGRPCRAATNQEQLSLPAV